MARSICVQKAKKSDTEAIYTLLKPFWQRGLILERPIEDIVHSLTSFFIATCDNAMSGVISFHNYGKHLKEIRSLVVSDDYSRLGIGSHLVRFLIKRLRLDGNPKIFVLSYSPVFFEKNSFIRVDKETLPEKIWKDCSNCKDQEQCGETALVYTG